MAPGMDYLLWNVTSIQLESGYSHNGLAATATVGMCQSSHMVHTWVVLMLTFVFQ